MKATQQFFIFSMVYLLIAFGLWLIAPEYCRDFICLLSKELVVIFSAISYLVLAVTFWIRHVFVSRVDKTNRSDERKVSLFSLIHLIIAGVLSTFGAVVFVLMFDGLQLDDLFENTIGLMCIDSHECEDVVGDVAVWVTGLLISFYALYYLPAGILKRFNKKL